MDLSKTAIGIAKSKPGAKNCSFLVMNFLEETVVGKNFEFVFDMGCFHIFHKEKQRDRFAQKVAGCLHDNGLWLSISGSCDGPEYGPPRLSALEITKAVEPYFEILHLKTTKLDELSAEELETLGLEPGTTPKAWECIMKKRSKKFSA